jgi:MFS family permease
MKKKDIRSTSGCLIVFFGISFAISSVGLILSLVMGGSLSKYFLNEDGESDFWWWKAQFWIVVIAIVVLLIVGGKLKNLRILDGFPYEEDE